MLTWKTKLVLAAIAATMLLEAFPRDADAFLFRWLRRRRAERIAYYYGGGYPGAGLCGATTTARVAYSPIPQPACGNCQTCAQPCAQQCCSYVPQVSYRTVYRQVPVTVYRPVCSVDPCTGCPTTVMQPCTSVSYQAQRVPVTTYRQVCQMAAPQVCGTCPTACSSCPTGCAGGCASCQGAVSVGSPVVPYAAGGAVASPGCASCGVSQGAAQSVPTFPSPSTSLQPVPSTGGAPMTVPGPTSSGAANTTPTLPQAQSQIPFSVQGSSNRTTQNPYQPRQVAPGIQPVPDPDRLNAPSNRAPALLNPSDQTALRSAVAEGAIVPISWEYTPARPAVSAAKPATPMTKRLDDSGWVPAM